MQKPFRLIVRITAKVNAKPKRLKPKNLNHKLNYTP
jgi:hypothetical protein